MTPETPTPETDALVISIKEQDQTDLIAAIRLEEKCKSLEVRLIMAQDELKAARLALAEAASHLSGFLGFHAEGLSLDQVRALSATLEKIKPFITHATPLKP